MGPKSLSPPSPVKYLSSLFEVDSQLLVKAQGRRGFGHQIFITFACCFISAGAGMEAALSRHVARGRGVGVTVVLRPMLGNTFPTPGKMQGI